MARPNTSTDQSTSQLHPIFDRVSPASTSGLDLKKKIRGHPMPVYQYNCATCGSFEETASISRFADPCECPSCGALSPRNLLSVPQLSTLNSKARAGHMINERASDNPKLASATGMRPTGPKIKSRARTHADGSKSMSGTRPWMLSH